MTGRGRPAALSRARQRARLQAAFLRLYDRDAEVDEALRSLLPAAQAAGVAESSAYWKTPAGLWNLASQPWERTPAERRPPRIAEITAFVRAADELAAKFGLDRLREAGSTFSPGASAAFERAPREARIRARSTRHNEPPVSGSHPRSSATALLTLRTALRRPCSPYALAQEPRRDARVRLERIAREHIQSRLDRIEAEARAAGLTFPDTAPNLQRDLGWLYRKVRFGDSFKAIVNSLDRPPTGGADTVRKAVLRMAARVGIDHSGWETGWR